LLKRVLNATLGSGRRCESELGTTVVVDQAHGLMKELEAQRAQALEDPAEGALPRSGSEQLREIRAQGNRVPVLIPEPKRMRGLQ